MAQPWWMHDLVARAAQGHEIPWVVVRLAEIHVMDRKSLLTRLPLPTTALTLVTIALANQPFEGTIEPGTVRRIAIATLPRWVPLARFGRAHLRPRPCAMTPSEKGIELACETLRLMPRIAVHLQAAIVNLAERSSHSRLATDLTGATSLTAAPSSGSDHTRGYRWLLHGGNSNMFMRVGGY
jgi:hypothetical protein